MVFKSVFTNLSGCLTTVTVLGIGVYAVGRGNTLLSQRMMRYRVAAQGATVLALVLGSLYHTTKSNRPSDR